MRNYFTQSHFRMTMQCMAKLNYTGKENYADNSKSDPFIKALANGGYQVKELAKYLFADDPETVFIDIKDEDISQNLWNAELAILQNEKPLFFDAPFRGAIQIPTPGERPPHKHVSIFTRVDFFQKHKEKNIVDIYMVRARSINSTKYDLADKKWAPMLQDLAYQNLVLEGNARTKDCKIRSYLILLDESKTCSVDGMNQMFTLRRTQNGGKEVILKPGLKKSDLDTSILTIIDASSEVNAILNHQTFKSSMMGEVRFIQLVAKGAEIFEENKRVFAPLSSECKNCQFRNDATGSGELTSGFHECWENQSKLGDELRKNDLVTDLLGGNSQGGILNGLLQKGKYLIKDVNEEDVLPKGGDKPGKGLSQHQRRMEQINRVKSCTKESYFDRDGFLSEAASWVYPLHMIDFETANPAIPFNKNRRPYEQIAFQFSHHTIREDGSVSHSGEYISFERGVFPNYDFLRNLKKQLEQDNGTIFRYSHFENTCLKNIYRLIESDPEVPSDKAELQEFIRSIIDPGIGGKKGERNMIDLEAIVNRYYYSPLAKSSVSLKKILPAIINDSEFLRNKYGKPVYGKGLEVPSLNFDKHVWIDPKAGNDPYKTLPKLFKDYDTDTLDELFDGLDEVAEGTAAMTAYSFLQYSDIPDKMREELRDGLLRYCELDTMAMVMLLEGLMDKAK